MNELIERIKEAIHEVINPEVRFVYDTDTAGNIADAKQRSAFFGDKALFWLKMALEADSPVGEDFAVKDAVLAYRYAKLAYALEHERFIGLDATEPMPSATPDNAPGKVITFDNGVSDDGVGQDKA
jgi:hypothetical protein